MFLIELVGFNKWVKQVINVNMSGWTCLVPYLDVPTCLIKFFDGLICLIKRVKHVKWHV